MRMEVARVVSLALVGGALVAGCSKDESPVVAPGPGTRTPTPAKPAGLTQLKVEDVVVGKGPAAANGDLLVVDYVGKLANGKEFDSSKKQDRGPFNFTLGAGEVIAGWDQGLAGMRVGGTRKLSVPAKLGYGDKPMDGIPPNSALFFDVKLLTLVKKGDEKKVENDKSKEKVGAGPAVKAGDTVSILYTGKLANGKVFDSTANRNDTPFTFKAGGGEVVPGFDVAVLGMKKGGSRSVKIPPQLAYGQTGQPGIPPNSVLFFDIKVVDVKPGAAK